MIATLFAAGALGRAGQKLLWHDEIVAAVIAGLPPSAMWTALRDGVDLNPPGFHLLLRASQTLLGASLIRTRLPSAAGVLMAALCAGVFIRRRFGAIAGLTAMLVFLCSDAYFYAYEARPYGAVLACAGAALVCWQAATSVRPRRMWLTGLFASMAGALTCHYYAVLLFVPMAAAELARVIRSRQPDWPLWMILTCSTVPLVFWWPLIKALSLAEPALGVREFSPRYFARPNLRNVLDSYESTMTNLAVPFLIACVLVGALVVLARHQDAWEPRGSVGSEHEWTLAAALTLLPVFAYMLAVGWTGALVSRYYLPWTLGLSTLVPMTLAYLVPHWRRVMTILLAVLFVWFGARQVASARFLVRDSPTVRSAYPSLFDVPDEPLPIVVGHPHVYLVALYYSPAQLQSRLVTLAPATGMQAGSDRVFRGLAKWVPVHLERFDEFIVQHRRFYVYGPPSSRVLEWLQVEGALLRLQNVDEDSQLFSMSRPGINHLYEVTLPPPIAGLPQGR